jgi:hypothetical protein
MPFSQVWFVNLPANVVNSQIRAVHNANDLDMENREGGAGDTHSMRTPQKGLWGFD